MFVLSLEETAFFSSCMYVYLLDLFVRQTTVKEQLYMFVNIVFLWNAFRSRNHIVSTCMNIASDNSDT